MENLALYGGTRNAVVWPRLATNHFSGHAAEMKLTQDKSSLSVTIAIEWFMTTPNWRQNVAG